MLVAALLVASPSLLPQHRPSEVWTREQEDAAGFRREKILNPLPRDAIDAHTLPAAFSWADQDGQSLVTKSLNQHIPQCARTP